MSSILASKVYDEEGVTQITLAARFRPGRGALSD
jgi:hypothetical protein